MKARERKVSGTYGKAKPGEKACACGRRLRSDNKKGVCTSCQHKRVEILVTEEQLNKILFDWPTERLNKLLLDLPLAEKARLVNAMLASTPSSTEEAHAGERADAVQHDVAAAGD